MITQVTILDGVTVPVLSRAETIEQQLAARSKEEWETVARILEAERERDLTQRLTTTVELSSADRFPDDMPVIWDGEETTWSTLSGNERMACEVNAEGRLKGGNPF